MAAKFSLAGLLRFRRLQEEVTGGELARANARVRDNANIQRRARRALSAFGDEATTLEELRAIASARSVSAAMLAELQAAAEIAEDDAARARGAHDEATVRATELEKLEHRHVERVAKEQVRLEQLTLDELTVNGWSREGDRR